MYKILSYEVAKN